jgi:hypothetical protein
VTLGIASLVLGIPIIAIVTSSASGLTGLIVVWVVIAAINIAYAFRPGQSHQHHDHR